MGRNVIAGLAATCALVALGQAYVASIPLLTVRAQAATSPPPTGRAATPGETLSRPAAIDIVKGADGWLFPGWDYLVDERQNQTAQAVLQAVKMAGEAKARGSRVILLLVPDKARVHVELLPADRAAWTRHHSAGFEQLAQTLRAKGLEVETAWPAFSPRDAHWTGESGEAVARQLAAKLADVARPNGPALPVPRWIDEKRYGDLANLARSRGDLSLPEDVFKRRDYVAPIAGEPVIEVVGNSFIDTYYGLPQELSRQLHIPVTRRVRQSAPGPWQAMRDYIAAGKNRPVIVWQLQETSFSNFGPDALQP
jgi:alginate O-acetyltransferase complex protein AlgJ